jgi:RNA polymerase sigma factor (sigma-70 family)
MILRTSWNFFVTRHLTNRALHPFSLITNGVCRMDAASVGQPGGTCCSLQELIMATRHAEAAAATTVESLLLAWQSTGNEQRLEDLVHMITPLLERVAARTLHRLGVHDRSAIDDTTALVFDHLRRLPSQPSGERSVMPFAVNRPRYHSEPGDSGAAYLHRLTHDRAIDVVRARRRSARRARPISELGDTAHISVYRWTEVEAADDMAPADADSASLRHELDRLEPRLRTVIAMLLEGKSQVAIAHELGVCEGTVSRLRVRAIDKLRRAMAR